MNKTSMRSPEPGGRQSPPQTDQAPADPTRDIAYDILVSVLERRRSLDAVLDRAPATVPARDRAAAHRLAAMVLRRLGTLDAVLRPLLARPPPPPVRLVLLLGAAQLLFLQTPAHAAVGTSVELVRRRRLAPFAGLVNAVLRRVAAQGEASLAGLDQALLDMPGWLWSSLSTVFGEDAARRIADGIRQEAPLDLTLRRAAAAPEGAVRLPTGTMRLPAGTRVADLAGYARVDTGGTFWVQDVAAALPVMLLDPQPGERIADLCAAPGGKTAQLVDAGAEVIALDRDRSRLQRVRENLDRLAMQADLVEADALSWRPPALLDAVLLDAPCSATGTARRHPEVLHTRASADLPAFAQGQARLIEAASTMLRPGGRLLYAVCSMQPEEAEAQLAVAHRAGLRHVPFEAAELAMLPEALTAEGCLRTHPGLWPEHGGMDGFFAARFVRT
ncbi:rRNA cytosine-C5-methylase [Lichenicoccus roseus]|uniref:rRNA cytosine-C5-methylase n=2 Tax=Lichenicoccus roseus TaxID=2683649 RepID=A0A5R9J2B6_9PROT|nr:rRNA cytosine-C5-methylase [Lichenicoccus roseus]